MPSIDAFHAPKSLRLFSLLLVSLIAGLPGLTTTAAESGKVDFNFQIRPLLSDRCFFCHGPDEKSRKAKLRLDTREGALKPLKGGRVAIKPGDPEASELVQRIFTDDPDDLMPPPESHRVLSETERELLKQWISEGAEYQPHWSLLPVKPVTVPAAKPAGSRTQQPIDAFIRARLERQGLSPAQPAARTTLIRRLALDLTGLPPTPAEIDAFLADTSTNAYARVVEHYLSSPAYGEHMAMDWLDLARFADTYGYQNDIERDMSPYRDWVIRAFNQNLPYDQFLIWQIAGDLLPDATIEQRLATAFNRLHRQTNEGGSIDDEFRIEYVADRVNTLSTAVLGVTFECARCHDHKYDPITQRDYFSMSAFFNSIDESGTYSHYTQATPSPAMLLWPEAKATNQAQMQLQLLMAEERLAQLRLEAQPAFAAWQKTNGTVQPPAPIAHFKFDTVISNTTPDAIHPTKFAKLVDGPRSVAGHLGAALEFSGDNELDCPTVPEFKRSDAFSFSLWLKPAQTQERAVVLHQSRAAADAGSRGFELRLDQGKPVFALVHFWPGNAAAIRATQAVPTNAWSHLAITYDGSSRASGMAIYLNGVRLETEVIRDNLYKDIVHRAEWGDMLVGKVKLALAGRFRDNGFKGGTLDELQVFNICLTDAEVASVAAAQDILDEPTPTPSKEGSNTGARPKAGSPLGRGQGWVASNDQNTSTFDYFLVRQHAPYQATATELAQLRDQQNQLVNDVPEIMVMQELPTPRPAFLLDRGNYDTPKDRVERDTPVSILPFPADLPRDRLGLAHWLTDRQNPLTARVVVNRIWRMHFGRGIVTSQENFGSQGALPSHPELLDWLTGWFMDQGWDVKALHRLIVASATYQQSSEVAPEFIESDPENKWLARGPKQRLLAEQIRDSALAGSGLLNRTIGGPSVKTYQPAGLWEASGTGKKYVQDTGDKLYRRSLYTFWKRTAPPPSMLTFDATSREVCTAKRETTTTPLQALVLLNDPQFVEAARVLGERLLKQYPNDLDARIRDAFRALTARQPDATERDILRRLFAEQRSMFTAAPETADKLLSVGESPWDKALPRADFAATTVLVSAVMNLDEFVVKR